MRKQVIYLSGPMSGIKDKNKFMFNKASMALRKMGYTVVSPVELDDLDVVHRTWNEYMMRDIPYVFKCDFVVLLPDWFKSRGTLLEIINAATVGKPIFTLAEILSRRRQHASEQHHTG